MKRGMKRVSLAAAAVLCLGTAVPAQAVEVKAGAWDFSLSGNVNAFATYVACGTSNADIGGVGLACGKAVDAPNVFSIESGLLPNALVFGVKTSQSGLDVSATVGIYPGLHVTSTNTGFGNTKFAADVRQGFLTFGGKSWGTVKLGKDLGIFGSDAILSDMTLLGVGAGAAGLPLGSINTTLGHIGTGYIYADWIPQIAYISPSWGGFSFTVAAVEAFRIAPANSNDTLGAQARLSYDLTAGSTTGRAWLGGMYQNSKVSAPPTNPSLTSVAGELGAKVSVSGLGVLAYGYYGSGVGTTVIGLDAAAGVEETGDSIKARPTYGFLGQVTYQIPGTKLRPGVSYGMSFVKLADGETNPTFLKSNAMLTVSLFYALTDNLTLVAEYDNLRSNDQERGVARSNSGALGAIIFF
jgi:predicted porin